MISTPPPSAPSADAPVLITGANGILGESLIHRFRRDERVVGWTHNTPSGITREIPTHEVDLTSAEKIDRGLEEFARWFGKRIKSVVHLAAFYDFTGAPSPLYDRVNVEGSRLLITKLREHGFEVEQFVFASTMLVMKPTSGPGEWITETSPTEATWAYPASKLAAEVLLRENRGDIPLVITRLSGVYDEYCRSLPISHQIKRIANRRLESRLFPGNLDHGQTFVHLKDLAEAFFLIVNKRVHLVDEEPFLLGEPDVMSYDEVQRTIGRSLFGRDWTTHRIPKWFAKLGAWGQSKLLGDRSFIKPWMIDQADAHYAFDVSKARERLGWEPQYRLRETIPTMVAMYEADRERWLAQNDFTAPASLGEALRQMLLESESSDEKSASKTETMKATVEE